jgi:hypothetical protein
VRQVASLVGVGQHTRPNTAEYHIRHMKRMSDSGNSFLLSVGQVNAASRPDQRPDIFHLQGFIILIPLCTYVPAYRVDWSGFKAQTRSDRATSSVQIMNAVSILLQTPPNTRYHVHHNFVLGSACRARCCSIIYPLATGLQP